MNPSTSKESGKAGKPGETPAAAAAGSASGNERPGETTPKGAGSEALEATNLTSDAITSLLQSEFAAEETGTPEREVQPATGDDDDSSGGQTDEEKPEGDTEDEESTDTDQGADASEVVPEALAKAIEEWEEAGGGTLPGPLQSLFERRIGKVTAQRESEHQLRERAEARVAELEAENEGLRTSAPVPAVPMMDEKALTKLEQNLSMLIADAENYLDDTANEEETQRIEAYMAKEGLDAKGLKRRVREYNTFLTQETPKQRQALTQFTAQERQLEPIAKDYFPWLWDKSSAEYGQAQEVLKVMPELSRRTPAHRFAVGIYVLGLKEFEKLKAAKGKSPNGKPPAKAPVKAPTSSVAAPPAAARTNSKTQQQEMARQRFNKGMTRESAAELLKTELLAS